MTTVNLKGFDLILGQEGLSISPVEIRNAIDAGPQWAVIDFEIKEGKRYVTACVSKSKLNGLGSCYIETTSNGNLQARIWTLNDEESSVSAFKIQAHKILQKRILETQALLDHLK